MSNCPYATEQGVYVGENECLGYYVMCEVNNKPCVKACGEDCETYRKWLEEKNEQLQLS